MRKTSIFGRTIGVFEGGGVRGAAFAGAYSGCKNAGVEFVGTVGTSAGSIAAVLIAADLSPEELTKELSKKFKEFLEIDSQVVSKKDKIWIALSGFFGKQNSEYVQKFLGMGLYSSEKIEGWVNSVLAKKLKIEGRKVQFKDLPKPTAIVAADVQSQSPRIWSQYRTPDSPVGYAVRCSCNIPFFFKPVSGEGATYVDGGLLANFPLFLVPELRIEATTPRLCFRLVGDKKESNPKPETGMELGKYLVGTLLDGATTVQVSMAEEAPTINIKTGPIDSTNFDITENEIRELVAAGEQAVSEFMNNETMLAAKYTVNKMSLVTREVMLLETSELISKANSNICIMGGDLSWFEELYITLLSASIRFPVKILCHDRGNDRRFQEIVQAAKSIGAEIRASDDHPEIIGTIIDHGTRFSGMILIETFPTPHGRIYESDYDDKMISHFEKFFDLKWQSARVIHSGSTPKLHKIGDVDLVSALPCYRECASIKGFPFEWVLSICLV